MTCIEVLANIALGVALGYFLHWVTVWLYGCFYE